jgi:hypothetical protein
MRGSEKAEIGQRVLSYLITNSDAGDTLEGIVEWWLMEQKIRDSTAEVKEALEEFTQKQLIVKYQSGDGRIHYRINRGKEKEIQDFLDSKEGATTS